MFNGHLKMSYKVFCFWNKFLISAIFLVWYNIPYDLAGFNFVMALFRNLEGVSQALLLWACVKMECMQARHLANLLRDPYSSAGLCCSLQVIHVPGPLHFPDGFFDAQTFLIFVKSSLFFSLLDCTFVC